MPTIAGHAVVYNSETVIFGLFREQIAPGAFDKSLREKPDVLALFGHDINRVLGRTTAGTLELRSDRAGLWFGLDVNTETPDGATALGVVDRQDVRGCSFGMIVREERWIEGGDDELPLRIIERADLLEVTLTAWPAYEATSASVLRSADDGKKAEHNHIAASRRRAEAAMRKRGIL